MAYHLLAREKDDKMIILYNILLVNNEYKITWIYTRLFVDVFLDSFVKSKSRSLEGSVK